MGTITGLRTPRTYKNCLDNINGKEDMMNTAQFQMASSPVTFDENWKRQFFYNGKSYPIDDMIQVNHKTINTLTGIKGYEIMTEYFLLPYDEKSGLAIYWLRMKTFVYVTKYNV